MINVTGLWKNKDKDGNTYYSGNWGNVKVLIFPNKKKTEDKHPDLNMVIAENKKNDKKESTPEY